MEMKNYPSKNQPAEETREQAAEQDQQSKRRRYRIPRSCDRCRASKVKCAFENGRCHACTKAGLTCTFANPGSLAERPPTYKDVEQLTARIRSLERLLYAVDPSLNLNDLPDPFMLASRFHDPPQGSSSRLSSIAEHHQQQQQRSPPCGLGTSSNPEQPSIVITGFDAQQSIPFKPPITTAHWSESDKSRSMTDYTGVTIQADCYIGPNSVFSTPEADVFRLPNLPPCESAGTVYPTDSFIRNQRAEYVASTRSFYPEPDLELELIKIYFQNFHPFVPILHPASFHALHRCGLAQTNVSFRALCLLIFNIASRHSSDPRVLLDLAGNRQSSRQFCGLRYAYAAYLSLFQLFNHHTNLFDLQAFVLLAISSTNALQPTISWIFVEQGLLRAQESGAHREVHPAWNANPLEDYLRRQAFFQLYELDHKLSATLGRTPSIQAEDFDLKPPTPQPGDPLGIFVNPYTRIPPDVHEIYNAFDLVRVSLLQVGSLHSMLPLLNLMKTSPNKHHYHPDGGIDSSFRSLKTLVDQIDRHATKWFDNLPFFLKRSNVESGPELLLFSVLVTTSYYEFQQLIHRTLFNYEEIEAGEEMGALGTGKKQTKTQRKNPHLSRCISYSVSAIQEMSKLRLRGLLTDTFFWLPGRVTLAAILLICSIRKQRKSIGRLEEIMRREHISLAIKILDDLAPSTYAATVHSKTIRILFGLLDVENPSLLESLASQTTEEINSPLLPTTGRHQSSDKSMPGNGSVLGGRCVASCSSSGEDPSPPAPAPPSGWDPIELTAFAYADPAGTTNQAFPFARPQHS
ncbi:hypothetical protein H4Q26_006227 [Puccinia striiformis f. sp. tritici PST-130]|nr:hypothetical protein Pst134EB_024911 [Puccinia striiformis f. sp. tritici]KAI9606690.1 hypothetical protein H4Q26_006227 [Puccinia striiformis f. sp. tritici PST-130]